MESKIKTAVRELEKMGFAWSMDLEDAVRNRAKVCDGKDTGRGIARNVAKNLRTA